MKDSPSKQPDHPRCLIKIGLNAITLVAGGRGPWSHELPEHTADNILSTFAFIHGSRGELFERGVISLFRRLSWDYKTNLPVRFGKRIILAHLLSIYGNDHAHAFLNHTTTDELDDLLRVLDVLAGKPEPDHRHGMYGALNAAMHAGSTTE